MRPVRSARCLGEHGPGTIAWTPRAASEPTLAPRTTSPQQSGAPVEQRYFGDYEILEEIARGGMGVVYKARQTNLDRTVALKTILAGQTASECDVERFYTEARAAANLQHPNIVAIHEFGEHEGQLYFTMDYVEGQSLASVVAAGPLPVEKAVTYLRAIADAIHYAHQHGILHRDLKPSNILIDRFDQPRVTDFGIAKRIGSQEVAGGDCAPSSASKSSKPGLTTAGEVLGTPSYMSPEQIDADPSELGSPCDVYALGAVLYELLTGRPPFQANTARDTMLKVLQAPPPSIRRLNRRVPRALELICLKCLEKDPHRRYRSASALADDLSRFELGQETLAGATEKALMPRIVLGSGAGLSALLLRRAALVFQLVDPQKACRSAQLVGAAAGQHVRDDPIDGAKQYRTAGACRGVAPASERVKNRGPVPAERGCVHAFRTREGRDAAGVPSRSTLLEGDL